MKIKTLKPHIEKQKTSPIQQSYIHKRSVLRVYDYYKQRQLLTCDGGGHSCSQEVRATFNKSGKGRINLND